MGIYIFRSNSIYEHEPRPAQTVGRVTFGPPSTSERLAMKHRKAVMMEPLSPMPNPRLFRVLRAIEYGPHLLAEILYPNCTTFEGRKILLFANTTRMQLHAAEVLDPHFTDKAPVGALVPVARFEPSERGWRLAQISAAAL